MDEEISIINNQTRKEKVLNFLNNNKKNLITLIIFLILIPFIFFSYQIYKDSEKSKVASNYNLALSYFEEGNETETIKLIEQIINNKDKTYSPLALYFIIDNNIQIEDEKINNYFDIIINDVDLDTEIKFLNIYKKGLFNSSFASENELLFILKPILNSDSLWKSHALFLLGEYFFDKNQNQKAKDFFSQIIEIENSNEKIKIESKKRLITIGD